MAELPHDENPPASGLRPPDGPVEFPLDSIGEALRKAFRNAVEEAVPDEMLDLLRRLD